jgi:hypothetical protein
MRDVVDDLSKRKITAMLATWRKELQAAELGSSSAVA